MAGEFWSNPAAEPKRSHRFLVSFELPGGLNTQLYARTFTKPGWTVGATEHQFLDKIYYYPGRVTWSEVTAQFVNSADPDMDEKIQEILTSMGWVNPNDVGNSGGSVTNGGTPNKDMAVAALGSSVVVTELDGEGGAIGNYKLNNPFVVSVSYGTLDYSSEDLLTVDIGFRYDWATYTPGASAAT